MNFSLFLFTTFFLHLLVFSNGFDHYANCNITDNLGNCNLCNSGFRRDSAGDCICGVSNCLMCSADQSNSSICSICAIYFGSQDSDSASCKSCYLDKCINCSLNSQGLPICLECFAGSYLQNGTCVSCSDSISDCALCAMNGTSLKCIACLNTADHYSNGTQCIKCGSDTGNEGLKNCKQCYNYFYGNYDPYCLTCQDGYGTVNGTCQSCSSLISNCTNCVSDTSCTSCADNFSLQYVSGTSKCYQCNNPNITNCSYCPSTTCKTCKPGYYKNSSNINNTCILCSDVGTILKNCLAPICQTSTNFTTNDKYIMQDCDVCQSGFDMKSIDAGYYIKNECVNCSESLSNCLKCFYNY